MNRPAPSPVDRYEELAEAAIGLVQTAAVAGIVFEAAQKQTAPYRVPANLEGYTDLLLTPLLWRAFEAMISDLDTAADKLDGVLKRHDV